MHKGCFSGTLKISETQSLSKGFFVAPINFYDINGSTAMYLIDSVISKRMHMKHAILAIKRIWAKESYWNLRQLAKLLSFLYKKIINWGTTNLIVSLNTMTEKTENLFWYNFQRVLFHLVIYKAMYIFKLFNPHPSKI